MKLFILAALMATASASVTSAEVRLNDNTGASVAAIRYNSDIGLVVGDLTVPGQAQANTAEVSDFLAKFHGEFDQLKREFEGVKAFIHSASGKIVQNADDIDTLEARADTLKGRADTLKGRADTLKGRADTLAYKASAASKAIDALDKKMDNEIKKINEEAKERHAATNAAAAKMAEQKGKQLIQEIQLEKQSLINNEIQAVADAALQAQETADAKVTLTKVNERLDALKQSLVQNEIKLANDAAVQAQNTADAKVTLAEAEAKVDAAIKELAKDVTKAQATADAKTTLADVAKEINVATNKLVAGEIQVALDAAKLAQDTANSKVSLTVVSDKIKEATEALKSTVQDAVNLAKTKTTLAEVQTVVDDAVKDLENGAIKDAMTVANAAGDTASAAATMQDVTAEVSAASTKLEKLITEDAQTTLKTVEDKIKVAREDLNKAISAAQTNAINEAKKTQITLKQVTDKVNEAKVEVVQYIARVDRVCGAGQEINTNVGLGDTTKKPCKACDSGYWASPTHSKCVPCRACKSGTTQSASCDKTTGAYTCTLCSNKLVNKYWNCWWWYCPGWVTEYANVCETAES